MRSRTLIAGALAGSLMVSGCANSDGNDVAGALLIGAAVIGLGILAAGAAGDDDHDDGYRSSGHGHHHQERSRYANNGRCDDPDYRTSNGGHAERGTDERDCRRYGNGLK